MNHKRFHLFRWWRKWQFDIWLSERWGFLSLSLDWRPSRYASARKRVIAYVSPDAVPLRRTGARGLGIE